MDFVGDLRFAGERFAGPMSFRLVLQPVMATSLAMIAGVRDARRGAPPFLGALVTGASHRGDLLRDAWRSAGRVFILAAVMEVAYQYLVAGSVSLVETLVVSVLLAFASYILLRGLVNRVWRRER